MSSSESMGTSLSAIKRLALCDNEDRISILPDDVLGLVLSFLATKEAVATSILSKRWEYAWSLSEDLYFTDENEHGSINRGGSFVDFVNEVLHYHGGTSTIRKFYLSCHNNKNCTSICEWVRAVIARNVQELTLDCSFSMCYQLPWDLTCKTLVALNITGRFVMDIPTGDFCFPNLNTLYLDGVLYRDDESAKRLFSCCPVLESLDIRRNHARDNVRVMTISSLSLKKLSIRCHVSATPILHGRGNIVIDCPGLKYFEFHASPYIECPMVMSSCMVEAHLHCSNVSGILNGISQVKHLVLSSEAIWSLDRFASIHDLPTFSLLKELALCVGEYVNWDVLSKLLASTPQLEVLAFPEGLVVYWIAPEAVPECLLSHLKCVEINNFVGIGGEICFVKYILEHAEVLEQMIIRCRDPGRLSLEELHDFLTYRMASEDCQLIFQ